MNLLHKTIIITGASDGIGKHIALKMAAQQCTLVLVARNMEKLDTVRTQALELGATAVYIYSCDIRDSAHIQQTVEQILADTTYIDILINNAGIRQKLSPVEEISAQSIENIISTNLTGLIHMTRLMMPTLQSRDEAAIINISSKSGVTAQGGQSVYTASKRGVRGFTEVLKTDLKESNIRVAGIYQSGTNTQMFAKTDEDFPIQKFTDPADLADVVVHMLDRPAKIWLHEVHVAY